MTNEPMLACRDNITPAMTPLLHYPLYASIKYDGIRCRIIYDFLQERNVAVSRTDKPIPNKFLQGWISVYSPIPEFLDGELIITDKTSFNDNQSLFMSEEKTPSKFKFMVFDHFESLESPFHQRLLKLRRALKGWVNKGCCSSYKIEEAKQYLIENPKDLNALYFATIAKGHEGLILRSPLGYYKEGRATRSSEWMLKMKEFMDAEAIIVGFEEAQHNQNEAKSDAFGRTKRSSHKANKSPKNTLGALIVKTQARGEEFRIGSGFTDAQRHNIWENKNLFLGQRVTYKYQQVGSKDLPRTPIFKAFRY